MYTLKSTNIIARMKTEKVMPTQGTEPASSRLHFSGVSSALVQAVAFSCGMEQSRPHLYLNSSKQQRLTAQVTALRYQCLLSDRYIAAGVDVLTCSTFRSNWRPLWPRDGQEVSRGRPHRDFDRHHRELRHHPGQRHDPRYLVHRHPPDHEGKTLRPSIGSNHGFSCFPIRPL